MLAIPVVPNAIDAVQLLREAIAKLDERGTEYDNTGQHRERSAPMIGKLFAGAADRELSDREVWLLLQQVKRARLHTAPGHVDSIVDLIAYTALEGEAMIEARRMADKAKENIKMVEDDSGPRYPILPPKLTKEQLALQLEALTQQERAEVFRMVDQGILYRPLYPTYKDNAPE